MQYEVIKFLTIGALSSVKSPLIPHQVPNKMVVDHNCAKNRPFCLLRWWDSNGCYDTMVYLHPLWLHIQRARAGMCVRCCCVQNTTKKVLYDQVLTIMQ